MDNIKPILEEQLSRCLARLAQFDPEDTRYTNVLRAVDMLRFQLHATKVESEGPWTVEDVGEPQPAEPALVEVPREEPPLVEVPKDEPKEEPKAEPAPAIDFATLRQLALDASEKGVGIGALLKQFVPEGMQLKLSNVPEEKYAEFVEAINNAG